MEGSQEEPVLFIDGHCGVDVLSPVDVMASLEKGDSS